jgi:hypothetical protein
MRPLILVHGKRHHLKTPDDLWGHADLICRKQNMKRYNDVVLTSSERQRCI